MDHAPHRAALLLAASLLLPAGAAGSQPNLVANGDFDSSLAGWSAIGDVTRSTADAAGSPHSGSARLAGSSTLASTGCVALGAESGVVAESRVWLAQGGPESAFLQLQLFSDASCESLLLVAGEFAAVSEGWQLLAVPVTAAAQPLWVRPALVVAEPSAVAYFDAVTLRYGRCARRPGQLCLNDSRFDVRATWRTADGATGEGRAVPFGADSGSFWFFSPTNLELDVKVLDACALNQRFWVFAAGLTDVEVTLEVTDTETGERRVYENPLGRTFQTITDTNAFATCP